MSRLVTHPRQDCPYLEVHDGTPTPLSTFAQKRAFYRDVVAMERAVAAQGLAGWITSCTMDNQAFLRVALEWGAILYGQSDGSVYLMKEVTR